MVLTPLLYCICNTDGIGHSLDVHQSTTDEQGDSSQGEELCHLFGYCSYGKPVLNCPVSWDRHIFGESNGQSPLPNARKFGHSYSSNYMPALYAEILLPAIRQEFVPSCFTSFLRLGRGLPAGRIMP